MSPVGFRLFKDVQRLPRPDYDALRRWRTADLSDAMACAGTMVGLRPVYSPIPRIVGPAVTVALPVASFDMLKLGLAQTRPGDVLVLAARADVSTALWGGILSVCAKQRGVAGLVVDGAVRDGTEIQQVEFPTFARGTATGPALTSAAIGEVNVPVACAGAVVNPGDIVVADEDGVVVVPRRSVAEVLVRTATENAYYESLGSIVERGEVVNIEVITERYREFGLEIVDGAYR